MYQGNPEHFCAGQSLAITCRCTSIDHRIGPAVHRIAEPGHAEETK